MKVCENKYFFNDVIPFEDTKILEFNQNRKFDKEPFIIYADLEFSIGKVNRYKNNPENSSTTKVSEPLPSGFSMSTILLFKDIENKHDLYWGKDCMKNFCKSLREHAMNIINFKKENLKLLTNKQQELYKNASICYIKDKTNIVKLEIIVIMQVNTEVLHVLYVI